MKFPFVVVLDNIRSAHNVGAIFRTCDGAGMTKLFLSGITPYPPHNRIPKTALGAIEFVEWERAENTVELIHRLKEEGFKIYSVEQASESIPYTEVNFHAPTAIVFGNEISGISQEVQSVSDKIIDLPMYGQKNSLNVATTVGIICYHAVYSFQS